MTRRLPLAILAAALLLAPAPRALAAPGPAGPVLEVSGPAGTRSFTLAALRRLPATAGLAGVKSSTGKLTLPEAWRGVALKDLMAAVGGFDAGRELAVVAKDGYAITFTHDQVTSGGFAAYDPSTGDTLHPAEPLTAILAYEHEGRPLDAARDGALRLVIVGPRHDLVTDGHWSVKWVTKLEVRDVQRPWSLRLEGALTETVDRATFEAGASPKCHGRTWRDAQGRVWAGIPLWLLVGRVDDQRRHEAGAYNDSLALTGYAVDVIGADGRTVTFSGARLRRDDGVILAATLDDRALTAPDFPLRLVGAGLAEDERLGGVVRIVLRFPAEAPLR